MDIDPTIAVWELTLECDSRCLHCGSNAKNPRADELDTYQSLELIDQLSDLGFKRVILSGGEPTLRPDWHLLARNIVDEGMELGIISNTLAWDTETIDKLEELDLFSVGISIDGIEATHDKFRGVHGSHKKSYSAIKELKRRDITVCAITTVNSENLSELRQIRNRLIVYDVHAWQLQLATPMGRMSKHKDITLSPIEHYRLGEFIAETRERLAYMNVQVGDCIGYYGSLDEKIRDAPWEGCYAGLAGLGIESNGNIKGCLSIQSPKAVEGNIKHTPLRIIQESEANFKYNRQFNINDLGYNCTGCDYGEVCKGGCST